MHYPIKLLRFTLLCCLFLVSSLTIGQKQQKPDNKYVYLKNHFTLSYTNGLSRTKFILDLGSPPPASNLGILHELNFNYTFNLKRNFQVALKAGMGLYPFVYSKGNNSETADFIPLTKQVQNSNYLSFTPTINYTYWLKKKWLLTGGVGVGIRSHANESSYNIGQFNSDWWSFLYEYGTRPKLFGQLELGANLLLKNQNFLGLSLGYNIGFSKAYIGDFEHFVNNQFSKGRIENTGNYPYLTLSYTFTRAKKWRTIEERFKTEDSSFEEARLAFKNERRFIHPKSIFIGPAGGGTYLLNRVKNDPYFKSSYHMSWLAGLSTEIGLGSNRYVEFGLSTGGYSNGFRILGDGFNTHSSSDFLLVTSLNGGYGVRLISKKGFNYFDLAGGVQIGAHFIENSDLMIYNLMNTSVYQSFTDPGISIDVTKIARVNNNFFPLLYAKVSRNTRITNFLYFTTSVQYNLGFYPISSIENSYSVSSGNDQTPGNVTVNLTGTGFQFLFGLKYKFVLKEK